MKKITALTLAGASLVWVLGAMAQEATREPAAPAVREEGGRGNRGGNPGEFRQRMTERLKESLEVSDEEWAVIQPLIEDVQTKQRAAGRSRLGGMRQRDCSSPESEALSAALQSDSTSNEEIQAKLTALRDSRKKAAAELAAAREELSKVLTLRQEAIFVQMDILE